MKDVVRRRLSRNKVLTANAPNIMLMPGKRKVTAIPGNAFAKMVRKKQGFLFESRNNTRMFQQITI